MPTHITSSQNPRIKRIVRLKDRRARDEVRQTVVEGVREALQAARAGIVPVEAFICPELIDGPEAEQAAGFLLTLAEAGMSEVFYVTPEVFAKVAYREQSGGLLLVIPYQKITLDDLVFRAVPFLVVVEEAEKPGNLGAILRTADAAGVDAVIIPTSPGATGTDVHNPNVIRASLGAYFTVPVVTAPVEDLVARFRHLGIHLVAATPEAEARYTAVDLTGPVALAVGSEAWGLSDALLTAADRRVRIPMAGQIDSLNLATATALLVYEVVRQRATDD